MREINKFLVFVLIAFLATSAKAATGQKKAAFSIHCKRPGIDCEVVGDKSSITTITSCSSPASWKPAAGQAYLLKLDKVNECLEKTQIRCDRNLIWLHNAILNGYDEALILCDDATSYDITYDSNQESLWQLDGITWSYQKRLCEGTGGKYQVSTGKCDCGNGDDEFSDSGCMCKYGDYKFINIDGEGCSGDLWAACHMSGGKLKVKDAFDTCNCPSELNLIQTETKSGCLCKLGFTWQNPMNKQLGCVEKGKKLNINLTIKSNSGEKLSGVTVKYSDESGKSHETLTDSNGTLKISNMPNTSYAVIAHDGYAPTTLSAVVLSSNTDLVLYQISQEHKGEYYQACVTQPENSSRAASGIQIKTNDSVRDNWVYCGGYINDKDCGNEAKIIGTDNIVYKCVVDPATKNGTWTPIDVQQLDRCMDHYSQIFCERYGKFEYMLYEDEGKIIALRGHADKVMSDGNIYSSAAWDSVCYQDVSDCETNKISCGENICNKLETGPKWGQEDSESQITLNDDVSSDEYDEESETSSNTSPNITADDIANRLNELGLEDDNKTDTNIKPEKTRLEQAEENYKKAKENEQSLANRTLTSATTAATGLGMMAAASARSEQKADADAEQDMAAYLATFKCEYGKGMSTTAGNEEITLPGGNELLNYYQEYK
ncbi:MAG: carboxypeptidase regulatory-like domain-containing protein, partial [Alphaproteobacteria bacterium]|nr:carboxypeptidase regulatory-like domain-containing protein [Alphaproteobacteria bacterium]